MNRIVRQYLDTRAPSGADQRAAQRRGITLLETLIAAVILLGMVLATSAALSSGQQQGEYAQEQVFGALAAEAKMAEILADEYANIDSYNESDELPGQMKSFSGSDYPGSYYRLGRKVGVQDKTHSFPGLGVDIVGKEVSVGIYDVDGNTVISLVRFVPEPES